MKIDHSTCDEESINRIISRFDQYCLAVPTYRKKNKFSKILVAASLIVLCITSVVAATGTINVSQFIKSTYEKIFPSPQMAEEATTVTQLPISSKIYNGMKIEVMSYLRDNDMFYMIFSLQDLEGDRLDETTCIYNYVTRYGSKYSSNTIYGMHYGTGLNTITPVLNDTKLIDYDPINKKATFAFCNYFTNTSFSAKADSNRNITNNFSLSIYQFASGMKQEEAFLDVSSLLNDEVVSTIPFPNQESYVRPEVPCLEPDVLNIPIEEVKGSYISNAGIVGNELRLLIKSEYSDENINRILDVIQKNSHHEWEPRVDFYLSKATETEDLTWDYEGQRSFVINNHYYDEYRFILPENPTSKDFELVYTYRTYDSITTIGPSTDTSKNYLDLDFNIESSLDEVTIPFKMIDGKEVMAKETILSPIGLMCYDLTIPYGRYGSGDIPLILLMKDGSKKEVLIYDTQIISFNNNKYSKTKLLFKEFIDINEVKEAILYLP